MLIGFIFVVAEEELEAMGACKDEGALSLLTFSSSPSSS